MKLNRRGFLGALGISTVAGPKAVAELASDPSVLHLKGVASLGGMAMEEAGVPHMADEQRRLDWALKKLAKKKAMDFFAINQAKKDFYIHALDPDTYVLRSMSLTAKMRRTREIQFQAKSAREDITLNRIVSGFED